MIEALDAGPQVAGDKSIRDIRYVPLTRRLAASLADHRHLRSRRVLCQPDGEPLTRQIARPDHPRGEASTGETGAHILRHTFCSILAMRGAPAFQELAGHADLTMTQSYMHRSPAALDAAMGDSPAAAPIKSLAIWGKQAARTKNDQ